MTATDTLTVRLTKPQHRFITTESPYPLMVAGFGSGKTRAAVCRAVAKKLQYPGQNVGYYLPTYDLVTTIALPMFAEVLDQMKVRSRLYKNEKRIHVGDSAIIFRTMDTPENIIGYEVADSLIDELDTLPTDKARNIWIKALGRNRQKKPDKSANTIGVATTPEGYRFVHEMWVANPKPGYEVIRAKTESNSRNLPEGYIDSLRAVYPPELLAAYLDGEFVNMKSGTVYRDYDRVRCASRETIKPAEPLYIGQDFNVAAMASIILVRRPDGLHAVAELTGVYDTPELIRMIKDRYAGHKVYIYPDASGGSRKTVDASLTDIALLQQAGFIIRAHSSNPPVRDRILAVNGAFSRGVAKVNVDACPQTAKCLEQQAYDKNGEPDKTSGLDHLNDAVGYVCFQEYPVHRPVTRLRIGGI